MVLRRLGSRQLAFRGDFALGFESKKRPLADERI
jgi:hypothetical protein